MIEELTQLITLHLQQNPQPSPVLHPLFLSARQVLEYGQWCQWLETLPIPWQEKRKFVQRCTLKSQSPSGGEDTVLPGAETPPPPTAPTEALAARRDISPIDPSGLSDALRAYLLAPHGQKRDRKWATCRNFNLTESQFYDRLNKLVERKPLVDGRGKHRAGDSELSEEKQLEFVAHCLKMVRHGNPKLKRSKTVKRLFNLTSAILSFKTAQPDTRPLSEAVFRRAFKRYYRRNPQLFKTQRQISLEAARQSRVDPPYLNNVWSWDTTTSQVYVYDPVNDRIFNPEFGIVVDEFAPVPLALVYFRDPVSKVGLASLLRMACLPKDELWRACGMPENLHGDKGGVQEGAYAAALEEKCQKVYGKPYFHVHNNPIARQPWKNGHAERFIGYVKDNFERCWCVLKWEHALGIVDKRTGLYAAPPRDLWRSLPTIEQLQEYGEFWVKAVALQEEHWRYRDRRTYAGHWNVLHRDMPHRVIVPDPAWLDLILAERATITVRAVQPHEDKERDTFTIPGLVGCKWRLQNLTANYGGTKLTAFYDPNDLRKARLFREENGQYIGVGEASLVTPHILGNQATERDLLARRTEIRRERKAQKEALKSVVKQAGWNPDLLKELKDEADKARADILPTVQTAQPPPQEEEYFNPALQQWVRG